MDIVAAEAQMLLTKTQVNIEKVRLVSEVSSRMGLEGGWLMTADELLSAMEAHYPAIRAAVLDRFAAMDHYYGRLREGGRRGGDPVSSEEQLLLWAAMDRARGRLVDEMKKAGFWDRQGVPF